MQRYQDLREGAAVAEGKEAAVAVPKSWSAAGLSSRASVGKRCRGFEQNLKPCSAVAGLRFLLLVVQSPVC